MISIFAKEAFLNINPSQPFRLRTKPIRGGHLQRVSSIIRGDQIAEAIGAKYNPTSGYENDTCIYVKPRVPKGEDFKFEGRKAYLDIIDGHNLGQVALKHPEVGVIVCSKADELIMKSVIPNEIVYIPQHHCNFERQVKKVDAIRRIGVIGELPAFEFLPKGLDEELKKRNIELVKFSRFFTRKDICDFYMSIDLQIVWRPYKKLLSNPLKIVNGMAFGVPTIALDERAFLELQNYYVPVNSFEEFLKELDRLRENKPGYIGFGRRIIEKSEYYHIDNIAKMYRSLDK